MLHKPNWGALVGGLVLLVVAGMFFAATLAGAHVQMLAIIPLLLVGLGCAAILNRRSERGD
ncbi:MAG: hypothetical protein ACRDMV_18590 [Streptosporangiales bacterium]